MLVVLRRACGPASCLWSYFTFARERDPAAHPALTRAWEPTEGGGEFGHLGHGRPRRATTRVDHGHLRAISANALQKSMINSGGGGPKLRGLSQGLIPASARGANCTNVAIAARTPNSALGRTLVTAGRGLDPEAGPRTTWLHAARWPAAALVSTYLIFVVAPLGKQIDAMALAGRLDSGRGLLGLDHAILQLISAPTLALGLVGVALGAQLVGRRKVGIRLVIAVAGAVTTAELLKGVLPFSDSANQWKWGAGGFPSGHVTIAAAFSLAALTLLPERRSHQASGPLVAWAVLVATSTVSAGWHRPSEALGGAILALGWHRALLSRGAASNEIIPHPSNQWRSGAWYRFGRSRSIAVPWFCGVALMIVVTALMSPPSSSESLPESDPSLYVAVILAVAIAVSVVVVVGYARPFGPGLNDGHPRRSP